MYTVILEQPAITEAEEAYLYIRRDKPMTADRWFNGLVDAVNSLAAFPQRCPMAPENDFFDEEIRNLIYGSYRLLFTIDEKAVHVLHIRHRARKYLRP